VLGRPGQVAACLFDLDGVLTQTARLHAAAWKEMSDSYLRGRSARTGEPFVPFQLPADYDNYADGRPRADGTRMFLRSRTLAIPPLAPAARASQPGGNIPAGVLTMWSGRRPGGRVPAAARQVSGPRCGPGG
jgi:hypothetical protein